jgi:predicted nucleic acid-binding protein
MFLIDTYAWVEVFKGTDTGKKVLEIIEKEEYVYLTSNLAEIIDYCIKNKLDAEPVADSLIWKTVDVTPPIAVLAGKIHQEYKRKRRGWGMTDSLLLAASEIHRAKIVTGDEHFKGLSNVIFIKD